MAAYHRRSPQAIAADIDHILDPAYKHSPPDFFASVYVDRKGNLHDPDFRPFPVHSRPSSPCHNSHQTRWDVCPSPIQDDDEDLESEELPSYYSQRINNRRHSPRSFYPSSFDSAESSYSQYSPSSSSPSSSSPSSCPFDDASSHPQRTRRTRRRYNSPIRYDDDRSALFSTRPFIMEEEQDPEPEPAQVEEQQQQHPSKHEDDQLLSHHSAATCLDALRFQWHTLALSVRFSVFRTKRSIRHKISRRRSG